MSTRGDPSWRNLPFDRRRTVGSSMRLTPGLLVLILITNALISLFISVIVVLVLGRPSTPPTPPTSLAPTQALPSMASAAESRAETPFGAVVSPGNESQDFYIVRAGDSLSAIATRFGLTMQELMAANGIQNPDWIGVGQKLVIPKPGAPTPTPTITPMPTATETPLPFDPPTPAPKNPAADVATPTSVALTITPLPSNQAVGIDRIIGAGSLADEVVVISNRGRAVSLEKWTLSDKDGNTYTFPNVVLLSNGATLKIHSSKGKDTPFDLYWNRTEPVWGSKNELATLKDAHGQVIDTFQP